MFVFRYRIEKSSETKAQESNSTSQVSPAGKGIQEQQTTTGLKGEKGGKCTFSSWF